MVDKRAQSAKEVEEFCNLIRAAVHSFPNVRIGQVISNSIDISDLFYAENDKINESIRKMYEVG